MPGQDHAAGDDEYGNDDPWVAGQRDAGNQQNAFGSLTQAGIQAEQDEASVDAGNQ